jgi:hypothetical protein
MKKALIAVCVMAIAMPCSHASIIVLGQGPFGILTDSHLDVPRNPDSDPVSLMVASGHYAQGFTVTVTGATGTGFLEFSGLLSANSFNGSVSGEYMSSWSQITAPYGIATTPWAPQGSTPISFGFGGPEVGVNFTFGVPQSFTLIADSYASYQFYPMIPGVPPYLAGAALDSSVILDRRMAVYSYDQNTFLQDATVVIGVPEPSTAMLLAIGLLILFLMGAIIFPEGALGTPISRLASRICDESQTTK